MDIETILVNGQSVENWLNDNKPVRPPEPELGKYDCCLDCNYPEYFESPEWGKYIQAMRKYQGEFQTRGKR